MSDYVVDNEVLICPKCDKGREVCTLCWNQDWAVFKQICHCGLRACGEHTIPCESVLDDGAHEALLSSPRLDAEAEHGGRHALPSGGWTEEDDALVGELLAEEDGED